MTKKKRKSTQIKQYPIFHCHHTFSSNNREQKTQKYCQCWQHKLIKHITKWFDCFYFFVFFSLYWILSKISNYFLGFVTKSWDLQKWEIRYFSFFEIFWFWFFFFCSVHFSKSKWEWSVHYIRVLWVCEFMKIKKLKVSAFDLILRKSFFSQVY